MKKPPKKQRMFTVHDLLMAEEARASVSLDKGEGQTNYCQLCAQGVRFVHTCGLRSITEEERAVVEAALFAEEVWDGPSAQKLWRACRALRDSRKEKR